MKSVTSYEIVRRYSKGDRLTYCRRNGYEWLTKMQSNDNCMISTLNVNEAIKALVK